jgi:hypothetical protein
MIAKLTDEMRAAVAAQPGRPVEIEDEATQRVYLLIDRNDAKQILDRWILDELDLAEADIAAGRVSDWNRDAMIQKIQSHPESR